MYPTIPQVNLAEKLEVAPEEGAVGVAEDQKEMNKVSLRSQG